MGYEWTTEYFAGETKNKSVLSWTGIKGKLTLNDTLNYLYRSGLENIEFNSASGTVSNRFLIPNGYCKVYEEKPIPFLRIFLKLTEDISEYFVFVSDPAVASPFQLPYSSMTGDKIKLEINPSKGNKYSTFHVKFTETNVELNDDSCVNYPTGEHTHYSECVESELREEILPVLGCMAPLISRQEHCVGTIQRLPEHENIIQKLYNLSEQSWGGKQYKPMTCLKPCSFLSAHATYQLSGTGTDNSFFDLHFEEDITIDNIVLAYDSTALLVEIGSCLGLWLGLSVVGIYDELILAVSGVIKIFEILFQYIPIKRGG